MNPFNKSYCNYISPPDKSAFFHNLLYEDAEEGSIVDLCFAESHIFCNFLEEYLDQSFSGYYIIDQGSRPFYRTSLCEKLAILLRDIERKKLYDIAREATRLSLMCNSKEGFLI